MIRRFLCLLLVCLMLAGQGLCFTHTHHGTDIAEPESHASRSHFHLGGHGHHDSTHNQEHHKNHSGCDHRSGDHDTSVPPAVVPVGDHDANAVYCCVDVITFARDGNSVIVLPVKYLSVAILRFVDQSDVWLQRLSQPASVFDAGCPIYLRARSLRI